MQPEEIGQLIAAAIVERRLAPGRRLNELELSRLLGVSRSAVRFALLALHHDGLVAFEANRGAFVAKPTLDEAHFLFEAIAANERSAVDIVLGASTLPSLAALRSVHARQAKAHAKGQMRASEQLAIDFHRELVALTGSADPVSAKELLGTVGAVVVTAGLDGASWVDADGVTSVPAVAAECIDSTGAGDAFDAGVLTGWLAGESTVDVLRHGTRLGALAVGKVGPQPT